MHKLEYQLYILNVLLDQYHLSLIHILWIYNIIQIPLQALANTTIGIVVLSLVNQLFWFLGIHGGMVIEGIRGPLSAAGLADNIAAVSAGHEMCIRDREKVGRYS